MTPKEQHRAALRAIAREMKAELREARALIPALSARRELDEMMVLIYKAEILETLIQFMDDTVVSTYAPTQSRREVTA